MGDTENRAELCQIAILLVVVSGFYFLLIPTGIFDPDNLFYLGDQKRQIWPAGPMKSRGLPEMQPLEQRDRQFVEF